ncbi:MAG: hypothetical protein L0Y56_05835 [Nitrospira sp.]|nr:hypothetical protein [Nitrospira sp.]
MSNQRIFFKAIRFVIPFLTGLGLLLVLIELLNTPFTKPTAVRAAELPKSYQDCPHASGLIAKGDSHRETAITMTIKAVTFTLSAASNPRGPIPGLETCDTYAVYYGPLDEAKLASLKAFDMVILHPDWGLTRPQVAELQAAGVIVLVYISIGEEPEGIPQVGDGLGPVHFEDGTSCAGILNRRCGNTGIASYYLDENPQDGQPDVHSPWNSYYVDPASPLWRDRVKSCLAGIAGCNFFGADYLLNTLGADGLFLDTVDTASPWHAYSYTLGSMAGFICTIRDWYPNRYIVMNRGIFYADPMYGADVVRPCINGIVWEAYYSEWDWGKNEGRINPWFPDNRDNWAPKLNAQAVMTDGYTVMALDYFMTTQQISITHQISETVERWGWLNYISTPTLDAIRWEAWMYCNNRIWLPLIVKREE